MLTMANICSFTIALPIAIVNMHLNILPTIVLRHNYPTLKSVLKRLNKKHTEREKIIGASPLSLVCDNQINE